MENSPAKMAAAEAKTVSELCRLYLESSDTSVKGTREDQRRIEHHILPAWGSRDVASLNRGDIIEIHMRMGEDSAREANRQLILVRRLLDSARRWGLVDEEWGNPATGISMHPESVRDAWSPW